MILGLDHEGKLVHRVYGGPGQILRGGSVAHFSFFSRFVGMSISFIVQIFDHLQFSFFIFSYAHHNTPTQFVVFSPISVHSCTNPISFKLRLHDGLTLSCCQLAQQA
jgi:hypothetical protein